MRRNSELLTALAGAIGVAVSLIAFLVTTFEYKGIFSSDKLYLVAVVSAGATAIFSVYVLRMKERMLRRKRIFIIYSHLDMEAATALVSRLREAGFDPWFDQDEIAPGQRIEGALGSGIAQSAAAILLVSKNLETPSKWLAMEIDLALSLMRSKSELYSPVIPVRLDSSPIPPQLEGVNWIQLDSKESFERLEKGLRLALDA